MILILRFAFLFILTLPLTTIVSGQHRPKVGLVLSGGAAHGLAHIGVIKHLEELGIQVDYISGTSMGAVIGGLKAMGLDANQIRQIAKEQDWKSVMSNSSPLYEIAPIEKAHHERIPLSIYWKDDSFSLPRGLIRGQKLDIALSNLYSPVHLIRDFDDFKIPFRCVAVDIESGSIHLFKEGYLAEAIRASMAIPSVFPPVELNGHLYVDGGLIRNLPVQECLDMGADYIIAVYVGSEKHKKEELKSMLDVLRQSASLASILDSEEQSKMANIVISPKVKKMGKFDFDNYDQFIKLGYDASKEYEQELKALATKIAVSDTIGVRSTINFSAYADIDKVIVTETDPVLKKMVSSKLDISAGEPISLKKLEESLSLIYGTKNFSKTSYSFNFNKERPDLKIITKDVDPYSIGISLNRFKHYNAAFIINAEARNVLGKPSNFRMDARISENPGMQGEYYLRIPQQPAYLFRLSGKFELYETPFINNNVIERLYINKEGRARAHILKEWKNSYLFSLGLEYRFDGLRPKVFKTLDFENYKTHKLVGTLAFEYNTLDSNVFPELGIEVKYSLGYVFQNNLLRTDQVDGALFLPFVEDQKYAYAQLSFNGYYHSSLNICSEFHVSTRYASGKSFTDNFKIGGPIQSKSRTFGFLGVDDSELIVDNHLALKYGLRLHISEVVYITPAVQYLYAHNLLSNVFDVDKEISVLGYGIILGIDSPIGPLTMDVGSSTLNKKLVVNLGVGYRHIF